MRNGQLKLFDLLIDVPWWLSVLFAGIAYSLFVYVFPLIESSNPFINMFKGALTSVGPFLSGLLLLPAPFAFFNRRRKKQLLDVQSDIDSIKALSWKAFEELVAEAYRRQGYRVIENGFGPDGGIDVKLIKDNKVSLVQCKQWRSKNVGVRVIREMFGVMTAEQAHKVIVICCGEFTNDAIDFAKHKPIELLGAIKLLDLVRSVQTYPQTSSVILNQENSNDLKSIRNSSQSVKFSKKLSWIKKAILLALSFFASFELAYFLDGKKLYLPDFFVQNLHVKSDLPPAKLAVSEYQDEVLLLERKVQFPHLDDQNKIVELYEVNQTQSVCVDHSLGDLKVQSKNGLYYWTDDKGVKHISDKKPKEIEYQAFVLAGEQVLDYFSLNITGSDVPFEFKEKLTRSITALFKVYGQLLSKAELKKVQVNLKFIASATEFARYKAKHAPGLKNIAGFYNNGSNQAVIFFSNYEQAFSTALHETTHAINRAVLGTSPKWLNEGLAEYLENIEVNLDSVNIKSSSDWERNGKLKYPILQLNNLLATTANDWNIDKNQNLYASSWAFVYFLMDDPKRKNDFARVIRHEQENLCNQLSVLQTFQDLGGSINSLQNEFNLWLKQAKITGHFI